MTEAETIQDIRDHVARRQESGTMNDLDRIMFLLLLALPSSFKDVE